MPASFSMTVGGAASEKPYRATVACSVPTARCRVRRPKQLLWRCLIKPPHSKEPTLPGRRAKAPSSIAGAVADVVEIWMTLSPEGRRLLFHCVAPSAPSDAHASTVMSVWPNVPVNVRVRLPLRYPPPAQPPAPSRRRCSGRTVAAAGRCRVPNGPTLRSSPGRAHARRSRSDRSIVKSQDVGEHGLRGQFFYHILA